MVRINAGTKQWIPPEPTFERVFIVISRIMVELSISEEVPEMRAGPNASAQIGYHQRSLEWPRRNHVFC